MSIATEKRRFTRAEYHSMGDAGILGPDDRVELIDGVIYTMNPIGTRHAACVDRLNAILNQQLAGQAIVRVQNPVASNDYSEPEPDLAILRARDDFYSKQHPGPDDIMLLIEVVDTSAHRDRKIKTPHYARSGVPELWLVDLNKQSIEILHKPTTDGYAEKAEYLPGETCASTVLPALKLPVDDILVR